MSELKIFKSIIADFEDDMYEILDGLYKSTWNADDEKFARVLTAYLANDCLTEGSLELYEGDCDFDVLSQLLVVWWRARKSAPYKQYYTLLGREGAKGQWCVEYGSWSKYDVLSKQDEFEAHNPENSYRIIITHGEQYQIDQRVDELNKGVANV